MPAKDHPVYLTRGLEGRDQEFDLLAQLFEESQVLTVETANPALDLISFAQDCSEFWVINVGDSSAAAPIEAPLYDWPLHNNSLGLHPVPPTLISGENTVCGATADTQDHLTDYPDTQYGPNGTTTWLHDNPNPPPTRSHTTVGYSDHRISRLSKAKSIAGFAYLLPSSAFPDAIHFEEYNMGIILQPHWRGQGVAEKALHLALDLIFSRTDVHRVQAQLIDCYKNDKALTLFTRMGFSHEGTRRQAFLCPLTEEWKDITTLALLVTDWFLYVRDRRNDFRSAPKSLWDALFARHQQEREELLRWQDRRPHRSSSLETIRETATPIPSSRGEADTSDAEALSPSGSERSERPKRKLFQIGSGKASGASDVYDASSSEYESEYASAVEGSSPKRIRSRWSKPNPATAGARALGIDWTSTNLDHLSTEVQPLADGLHHLDGGQPAGSSSHVVLPGHENTGAALEDSGRRSHRSSTSDQSRSPSTSPDSRESSIVSVPSSEFGSETESEDGYTAPSSPESSNWEFIESDDDVRF